MKKKVIIAGLLGFFVLFIWMIVVNGIFRFHSSINMNQIEGEEQVYEVLKEHIVVPKTYFRNALSGR